MYAVNWLDEVDAISRMGDKSAIFVDSTRRVNLHSMIGAIPYNERYQTLPSGTALIWPFVNKSRREGPYELFLDTNAFTKYQWADELPTEMKAKAVLNPWPALMEQLISNKQLTAQRIEQMIYPFSELGFRFCQGYANQQFERLRKNEAQIRYQYSVLFPFIAIMRSLLNEKIKPEVAVSRMDEVLKAEVPLFAGSFMLTALAIFLKARQSWRFKDDGKPAYSYLESFLAHQPGKKDESNQICLNYLRNRSGDLSLMYMLPALLENGYRPRGEPVLVTGDKVLHRLIFRTLPAAITSEGRAGFVVMPGELEADVEKKILEAIDKLMTNREAGIGTKIEKMKNLFNVAQRFCSSDAEKLALETAWLEWCKPGMGLRMNLS